MDRINTNTTPVAPGVPVAGDLKQFDNGTVLPAWWLNMVQEEMRNVVLEAGLVPDPNNHGQIVEAIQTLVNTAWATQVTPYYTVEITTNTTIIDPAGFNGNIAARYSIYSSGTLIAHTDRCRDHNSLYGMKVRTTVAATNAISMQFVNVLDDLDGGYRSVYIFLDGVWIETVTAPVAVATNPQTIILNLPLADTEYLIEIITTSPDRGIEIITEFIDTANECVFVPPVNGTYH